MGAGLCYSQHRGLVGPPWYCTTETRSTIPNVSKEGIQGLTPTTRTLSDGGKFTADPRGHIVTWIVPLLWVGMSVPSRVHQENPESRCMTCRCLERGR